MRGPYIGVTGITSQDQTRSLIDLIPKDSDRLLMVGVLASLPTLRGETNKWPKRYPKIEEIGNIFFRHPRLLNLIHYNTKEPEALADQLLRLTALAGPYLDGFQLNMAWPSLDELAKFHKYCGRKDAKQIVLQIGAKAFELVHHSPQMLAERVAEYEDVIDYVLLDASGGLGKPLVTEDIRAYLAALTAKKINVGLGVAGGLSYNTLHLVQPLITEFNDLSFDAEGQLRDEDDNLHTVRACLYAWGLSKMCKQA